MITAIILAAGLSRRMGQPKLLLPWGDTTVLGQVIGIVKKAGIEEIIVVTGGAREQIENVCSEYAARSIRNEDYARGEMLSSVQCGLRALSSSSTDAALIVLGDQPQVEERSVRSVCAAYRAAESLIVVPSYARRRGHPWLVARPFWHELLEMKSPGSPRDFMNARASEIEYVEVDTPTVIEDLDTPQDYLNFKP